MRVSERRRANNNDEEEDDDSATAGCRCYSNVKEGPYKRATRPGSMRWYWDWGSWVVGWGGALEVPRSRRERYPAAVVAQHQSVGVGRSLSLPLKRKSLPLFLRALVVASLAVVPAFLYSHSLSQRWRRSGRRWLATALPRNKVYWNVWASRRTRPSPRNYARRTRYRARDRLALSSERECELVAILMRRNSRWTGSVCRGDDVVLARDLQATA